MKCWLWICGFVFIYTTKHVIVVNVSFLVGRNLNLTLVLWQRQSSSTNQDQYKKNAFLSSQFYLINLVKIEKWSKKGVIQQRAKNSKVFKINRGALEIRILCHQPNLSTSLLQLVSRFVNASSNFCINASLNN